MCWAGGPLPAPSCGVAGLGCGCWLGVDGFCGVLAVGVVVGVVAGVAAGGAGVAVLVVVVAGVVEGGAGVDGDGVDAGGVEGDAWFSGVASPSSS